MNRRTRLLVAAMQRMPRPDPPPARYLVGARRELPRRLARLLLGPVAASVRIDDRTIPGPDGCSLRVRRYRSGPDGGRQPLVVNFHGGGFVFGNLTAADWLCGNVAERAGVTVVSVDYRLAPEHPAPIPFTDAWAATAWCLAHATELEVDPDRVTLMGESAGGNLAALVALASRDRRRVDPGWPALTGQILIYPALDLTMSSASVAELGAAAPVLRKSSIDWYGRQYVPQGRPDSIALDDPRVSPMFAPDHADLPPTLLISAGQDPLRDDVPRYAEALRAAAVPTRVVDYPDAVHGFASIPLFEEAAGLALDEVVAELRG